MFPSFSISTYIHLTGADKAMSGSRLLEFQTRELKFLFEPKKQSDCSVEFVNKTDHHVAFKIKTTSPKKYCVRPNAGVVLPRQSCEVVVTMQAQRSAPPDMICMDRFLIQSTIVPADTLEEDVHSAMFTKDDGRYVEEKKMKVILVESLVPPPDSPEISPMKRDDLNQVSSSSFESSEHVANELAHKVQELSSRVMEEDEDKKEPDEKEMETVKIYNEELNLKKKNIGPVEPAKSEPVAGNEVTSGMAGVIAELKQKTSVVVDSAEVPKKTVVVSNEDHNSKPTTDEPERGTQQQSNIVPHSFEDGSETGGDDLNLNLNKTECESSQTKAENEKLVKDIEAIKFKYCELESKLTIMNAENYKLVKEVDTLKSNLSQLESKLTTAETMITKLTHETVDSTIQEHEWVKQELALLRSATRKGDKGAEIKWHHLLFIWVVAVVSVVVGYCLHP